MNNYCVYDLQFPNGKHYIGISKDAEKRWRNGKGYDTQGKIANAIKSFGWDNVKHKIICDSLTKEQAERLEEYLISELNTIEDGYNTTIGGNTVNGSYLDEYVLSMIRYIKHYQCEKEYKEIALLADNDRFDKKSAEFWNECARAITEKHRLYSTTFDSDVLCFWYYAIQYLELYYLVITGKDTSNWKEQKCPWERYYV